jgi:dethiobiotin synthetase
MKAYFVTGTDTDVGKTVITQGLIKLAVENGNKACGFKPISAGCEKSLFGLRNQDAEKMMSVSNVDLSYAEVNPIAFEPPIAPHIAAREVGATIELEAVNRAFEKLKATDADTIFVEGAGGWRLPLGGDNYLSDFVVAQQLPVILVVGLKLGCLNHALLTAEAIVKDGLQLAGWVANTLNPDMAYLEQNVEQLISLMPAPCLGFVPQLSVKDSASRYLKISDLAS